MNDFFSLVRDRYSCRQFTPEPPSEADIERILTATTTASRSKRRPPASDRPPRVRRRPVAPVGGTRRDRSATTAAKATAHPQPIAAVFRPTAARRPPLPSVKGGAQVSRRRRASDRGTAPRHRRGRKKPQSPQAPAEGASLPTDGAYRRQQGRSFSYEARISEQVPAKVSGAAGKVSETAGKVSRAGKKASGAAGKVSRTADKSFGDG